MYIYVYISLFGLLEIPFSPPDDVICCTSSWSSTDKVDAKGERIVGLENALDDDSVRTLPKLTKDLQNIKTLDESEPTAMATQSNGTVDTS